MAREPYPFDLSYRAMGGSHDISQMMLPFMVDYVPLFYDSACRLNSSETNVNVI